MKMCWLCFRPTASGFDCIVEDCTLTEAGVKSYDVSLDTQTADVVTEPSVSYDIVLEKIKKTGKKVNEGWSDGAQQAV